MTKIITSVVIPALNAEGLLPNALRSIAQQRCSVDEVVVVDDGSTDGTARVINEWSKKLPITLVSNSLNVGICRSLQKGVAAARGELILRLDADDKWLPAHVESLLQLSVQNRNDVLFAARAQYVDRDNKLMGVSRTLKDSNIRGSLMWDNPLVHSAVAFRKEAYILAGGYLEGSKWEDYSLWVRLLSIGGLGFKNEITALYTSTPNSLSRIAKKDALRERLLCQRMAVCAFSKKHPVLGAINRAGITIRRLALA